MHIAEKIKRLRKQKGVSQEELADKTGVSRQAVSKWEGGQSTPDIEKLVILSSYFGVTTDSLLKDETSPAVQPDEDSSLSLLREEVNDNEYRYAANEQEKKKHGGYWIKLFIPAVMIAAIFIIYYILYR